jgi:hypothetical protein
MNTNAGILPVQQTQADVESIRRAPGQAVGSLNLNRFEEAAVPSSRLAGLGMNVVWLDLYFSQPHPGGILAHLCGVHGAAPSSDCAAPAIGSLPRWLPRETS